MSAAVRFNGSLAPSGGFLMSASSAHCALVGTDTEHARRCEFFSDAQPPTRSATSYAPVSFR
jgi:hypothetical protein